MLRIMATITTTRQLPNVKLALCAELSYQYHLKILEALSERECTNDVAVALN